MRSYRFLLISGLLLSLLGPTGRADEDARRAQLNSQIDIRDPGRLDREEVLLGLKNLGTKGGLNLPKIKAEGKFPKGLTEDPKLLDRYEIFLFTQKAAPPYRLADVDPAEFGISEILRPGPGAAEIAQRRRNPKFDINLRRETKQLFKALEDPYAQGALFSYGRDYLTDEEKLSAKGVLGISYSLLKNEEYDPYYAEREAGVPNLPRASNILFLRNLENVFTFEFDRLNSSKAGTAGTDKLAFGLHTVADLFFGFQAEEFNLQSADADRAAGREVDISKFHNPFLRSVLVDLSAVWTTDSGFDQNIQSLALDFTPFFSLAGSGRYGHISQDNPLLSYRWSVTAHLEAGTVKEAGTATQFKTDEFARAGGAATLELLFFPIQLNKRLSGEVSYLYYQALNSDVETVQQFRASVQWILAFGTGVFETRKSGARGEREAFTALRVEYVSGTTPITLEKEQSLLVGLGVAF